MREHAPDCKQEDPNSLTCCISPWREYTPEEMFEEIAKHLPDEAEKRMEEILEANWKDITGIK